MPLLNLRMLSVILGERALVSWSNYGFIAQVLQIVQRLWINAKSNVKSDECKHFLVDKTYVW